MIYKIGILESRIGGSIFWILPGLWATVEAWKPREPRLKAVQNQEILLLVYFSWRRPALGVFSTAPLGESLLRGPSMPFWRVLLEGLGTCFLSIYINALISILLARIPAQRRLCWQVPLSSRQCPKNNGQLKTLTLGTCELVSFKELKFSYLP